MSSRLESVIGVVAALVFGVSVAVVPAVIEVEAPSRPVLATSTMETASGFTLPELVLPTLALADESAPATTSLPAPVPSTAPPKSPAPAPTKPKAEPPAQPVVAETAVTESPAPAPPLPSSGDEDLDAAASSIRAALVNIICYTPAGSRLHSMSGSGIIIDPKGIILTNAHVAQYYLLKERGASCTIRTGGPAADRYKAELVYIPESWIRQNASLLSVREPSGTGELDFALLAITKSAISAPLPASFPHVPPASAPPSAGTPVVIASYGAQFLESAQIQSSLFPTLVFGSVKDVFTFGTNTIDVVSLGGSAAAQEGSSGGGFATAAGTLGGTITTSTITGDTSTRTLHAITLSYIRAAYAGATGRPLEALLAAPTAESVSAFAPEIPSLAAVLTANL